MSVPTACVIGWPIAHSRSPAIHKFWLNELGIAGDYVRVPVEPDRVADFLAGFADSGYVGGNVTIPHKEAAFAAVAEADSIAAALGAVNTLWFEDGRLCGSNTDVYGFLANLDAAAPGWDADGGAAVVLGAGGASRAVIWGLIDRGFAPIHLINRTVDRARALALRFGEVVRPAGWDAFPACLAEARILVNATELGMAGRAPLAIDLAPMPEKRIVCDLVYVPLQTPLLAAAKARGLTAVDGLGMLLHQAVPGFERWFGRRPLVSPSLRAAILVELVDAS